MTKSDSAALRACYLSGQMSEAQWQEHIANGDVSIDELLHQAVSRSLFLTKRGEAVTPWLIIELVQEIERLRTELRLIAQADHVDLMLDPSWAKRIALLALEGLPNA